MNCNKKQKYDSKQLADEYCEVYNNDILVNQIEYLGSYWCNRHRGWHIGHLKRSDSATTRSHHDLMGLMDRISREETQRIDEGKDSG